MRCEIEVIDGLYCVFKNGRIIVACKTLKEAKEAVSRQYQRDRTDD